MGARLPPFSAYVSTQGVARSAAGPTDPGEGKVSGPDNLTPRNSGFPFIQSKVENPNRPRAVEGSSPRDLLQASVALEVFRCGRTPLVQPWAFPQARAIEAMNRKTNDAAEHEGKRRPQIKLLNGKADE